MVLEDLIYDVKEIKAALEDDTDLEDSWLIHKANNYRAILISEQYRLEPVIDPAWLQPLEKFAFTKTDAADDPAITVNSITLGRAIIPPVVSLPEDLGFNRLTGSGGIISFEPTDFDTLTMKALVKEEIHRNYGYYARIGLFVYVYPYVMEGKAFIIAEDPTTVKIHDGTSFRDMIISGENGQTPDQYPIDAKTAQMIVLQILTVDLKLNDQAVTDVVNDSQSNLRIMKDGASTQKKN